MLQKLGEIYDIHVKKDPSPDKETKSQLTLISKVPGNTATMKQSRNTDIITMNYVTLLTES